MSATTTQQLQANDVNDNIRANHQGSRCICVSSYGYVFFFTFFFGFLNDCLHVVYVRNYSEVMSDLYKAVS